MPHTTTHLRSLLTAALCFLLAALPFASQGQSKSTDFYFLSKQDLKKARISVIKDCSVLTPDAGLSGEREDGIKGFYLWRFQNGRLEKEEFLSDYEEDTSNLTWAYEYSYKSEDTIQQRSGDGMEYSNTHYYAVYHYVNHKLAQIEYGSSYNWQGVWKATSGYEDSFFYNKDARLMYCIPGDVSPSHLHLPYLKAEESIPPDMREPIPEDGPTLYKPMMVYVYDGAKFLGFLSKRDGTSLGLTNDDFNNIRKVGFEVYQSKIPLEALHKAVLSRYREIEPKDLTFDGLPVREYLAVNLGVVQVKNLIIELADNYFLYYRIKD